MNSPGYRPLPNHNDLASRCFKFYFLLKIKSFSYSVSYHCFPSFISSQIYPTLPTPGISLSSENRQANKRHKQGQNKGKTNKQNRKRKRRAGETHTGRHAHIQITKPLTVIYKGKTRKVKRKCPNKIIRNKKISKNMSLHSFSGGTGQGLPLSVASIPSDVKKAL